MPLRPASIIVSSTSLIISGSSAEVGSSNSINPRAHAQAAGDRHPLLLAAGTIGRDISGPVSGDLDLFQENASPSPRPLSWASCGTQIGARVQFFQDRQMREQVEMRNNHPDFRADLVDVLEVVRPIPSRRRRSVLFWCSSSRGLMQRISVDLPDPDGPQMDDPLAPVQRVRLMSRRTWNVPNHLFMSVIWDGHPRRRSSCDCDRTSRFLS